MRTRTTNNNLFWSGQQNSLQNAGMQGMTSRVDFFFFSWSRFQVDIFFLFHFILRSCHPYPALSQTPPTCPLCGLRTDDDYQGETQMQTHKEKNRQRKEELKDGLWYVLLLRFFPLAGEVTKNNSLAARCPWPLAHADCAHVL